MPKTQEIYRKTVQQELTREGRLPSASSHNPTSLKGGGFGDGAKSVEPRGVQRKAEYMLWKKGTEPRRTAPQETSTHARVVVEALEGG